MVRGRIVIHVKDTGTTRAGKPRLSDTSDLTNFVNKEYQRLMWELPNILIPSIVIRKNKCNPSKMIQLESPAPTVIYVEIEIHEYVGDSTKIEFDILPTDELFYEGFMALYNA